MHGTINGANGTNGANGHATLPKIKLYTNRNCPFAHRAHITLKELGLPYEEIIIDLDTPREPWYLKVNPRGLVPSLEYSYKNIQNQVIIESSIVAQFLADAHPSHLLPTSTEDPVFRARVNLFVDTWNTKILGLMFPILFVDTFQEKEERARGLLQVLEKEIEPLLHDANPFFGGSQRMTLAEVQTAPFLLRGHTLSNDEMFPKVFLEAYEKFPNLSRWSKAVMSQESVLYTFNEQSVLDNMRNRVKTLKAQQKRQT